MTASEYIAFFLASHDTTDAFGIPGGVILDLIYAMESTEGITPHLMYHEQSAGFAACGYAQNSGKLGVAYATRGPGFTNLISAIADAYCDSLPVLFITGHSAQSLNPKMRVMDDQEFDTCSMVSNITKYAKRVDTLEDLQGALETAYTKAQTGRKGPVFLDIWSGLYRKELNFSISKQEAQEQQSYTDSIAFLAEEIKNANRPVFLIGDGINQVGKAGKFRAFAERVGVPVVSSRFSHDVMGDSLLYYGYIGSHGMRAASFVLSKADTIISIGNRLHFPVKSDSYRLIIEDKRFIRIELDDTELERSLPKAINVRADIEQLIVDLSQCNVYFGSHQDWIAVCDELKQALKETDINDPVKRIAEILQLANDNCSVACDVGNNEFWVSCASVYNRTNKRVQYSKSFGVLGCGLGKAIGVYYATHNPVISFIGDQGLQLNIQELQYIAQHNLPISVVVLNNHSSGMIKDRQVNRPQFLHTTESSGYTQPNLGTIANAYGISYSMIFKDECINKPQLVEIEISEAETLHPSLPKGEPMQNLFPELPREQYEYLNNL